MSCHSTHSDSPLCQNNIPVDTLFDCDDPCSPISTPFTVHRVHGAGATPAELILPSFTRRCLQGLPNWSDWSAAFDAQLDAHHKQGTFGIPCCSPPGATILCPHWGNIIKADGCRLCANSSKHAAPALHDLLKRMPPVLNNLA